MNGIKLLVVGLVLALLTGGYALAQPPPGNPPGQGEQAPPKKQKPEQRPSVSQPPVQNQGAGQFRGPGGPGSSSTPQMSTPTPERPQGAPSPGTRPGGPKARERNLGGTPPARSAQPPAGAVSPPGGPVPAGPPPSGPPAAPPPPAGPPSAAPAPPPNPVGGLFKAVLDGLLPGPPGPPPR